jgi:hypothetical protein
MLGCEDTKNIDRPGPVKAGDGQAGIRQEFCEGSEPAAELRHGERMRQPGLVAIAFKGIVSCDEYLVWGLKRWWFIVTRWMREVESLQNFRSCW